MWPIVVSPAIASIWKGVTAKGPAPHRLLDAPVLIAQRYFQVIDRFPVTLEPEMARLDNPGVDGADRHLMDLLALHAEEVDLPDRRPGRSGPVHAGNRTGLSQGWPSGIAPGLLEYLPLEKVHLGKLARVREGNRRPGSFRRGRRAGR